MTKPLAGLPLDERIPLALTQAFTAVQVAAVRGEAEEALADLTARADAADVASLSPLATREQAAERRAEASALRWEVERYEASVAALSARAADLRDQERRQKDDAVVAEVVAERDALAADIAREYPELVTRLTKLAKRIHENDLRCLRAGIRQGAECIARRTRTSGYSSDMGHHYATLGNMLSITKLRIQLPFEDRPAWESTMGEQTYRGLNAGQETTR